MDTTEHRVHPNCIYKSNPYHECVELCFDKMAQGNPDPPKKKSSGSFLLVVPKRLSFRKKKDPDSDLMPTKSIGKKTDLKSSLNRPDSPSSSPVQISFNKVESWNCDFTTLAEPGSKPNPPQEGASFLKFLPQSKNPEEDESNRTSEVKDQEAVKEFDSMRSTLTGTDQSTEESDVPDTRVPVGNYFVKESISVILPSILSKYGDIAESCKLESAALRSHYLECVCVTIQELESMNRFAESKLKEMVAIVKDAESVGINVGWMSPVVDRIGKLIELINLCKDIEAEKMEFESNVESTRTELEVRLRDLAEKEKEVSMAKDRVEETRGRLNELEEECLTLSETMVSIKSKVDSVDYKFLVGDIL